MQRDTTKRYYAIHSWVGAITAILIFVIAYTGSVSVFGRPELKIWAHEVSHVQKTIPPAVIEGLIRDHADTLPAGYLDEIQVLFPGVRRSPNLALYFERDVETADGKTEHHVIKFAHHPETFELIARSEGTPQEVFAKERKDFADFLIKFHADLHLGDPFGLLLTGLMGLTLFASIVTGVVTHRKVLKEAFTFRPFRSLRLLFTDSHKVLGVWGMLFHATIAFTGAFLGLAVVLLLPAAAFVSFEGDLEKMVDTYLPLDMPAKSGIPGELRIAEVLESVDRGDAGSVLSVQLLAGTDRNAVVLVNTLAGEGIIGETLRYRVADGVLESRYTQFSRLGGAAGPVLDAMFPLHFGNFAGVAVKFVWFFLGLATAMLAVSGMMIWVERRVYGGTGTLTHRSYMRIARLTTGACAGVVLASVVLFHAQLFVMPLVENTGQWLMGIFFGSWALAILWGMLRANPYQSTRELLGVTGLLAAGVPVGNALVTGNHLFNVVSLGHWTAAGVDLSMLLAGVCLIVLAIKLPKRRPVRKGKFGNVAADSTQLSGSVA